MCAVWKENLPRLLEMFGQRALSKLLGCSKAPLRDCFCCWLGGKRKHSNGSFDNEAVGIYCIQKNQNLCFTANENWASVLHKATRLVFRCQFSSLASRSHTKSTSVEQQIFLSLPCNLHPSLEVK